MRVDDRVLQNWHNTLRAMTSIFDFVLSEAQVNAAHGPASGRLEPVFIIVLIESIRDPHVEAGRGSFGQMNGVARCKAELSRTVEPVSVPV